MAEMEIELNLTARMEWDRIQESGKKLQPLYGPGFTGLKNLGNTSVSAFECIVLIALGAI
jgi:ubiquitin carboxyl-terminal hydrolase 5/13